MSQPKFLDELLAQRMNRKEFLNRIGAMVLALVGVTGLLKTLSTLGSAQRAMAYGSASFGGETSTARAPGTAVPESRS